MFNEENIILKTDSYKASHWLQLPPKTTKIFSYIESRGGRHDHTVMFGLQYYLKRYLQTRVTVEDVTEAEEFFKVHGEPFNKAGWLHIVNAHDGLLPLRIRAVPEGTVVPVSNALVTVENTCPHCAWVTSYVETMLLRVWYPITVATESRSIKKIIKAYLDLTSDDPEGEIAFKLHDFGARGVSSQESAGIGGAAHLINFMGSDTIDGVRHANHYYKSPMAGFSIPAAEHSTITSWGREHEVDAYRNMLKQFGKPGALLAVVSDSYDIFNACENLWGGELKQEVIDSGAVVVIRPDSGHPATVVLKCLELLDKKFGHVVNKKGYKVINNVRVIQGDGINADSIAEILTTMLGASYSATNVAFGMGGALLQQHNRDTQQFAMKCSYMEADGKGICVFKNPVGDRGKKSKTGKLDLVKSMFGTRFATVAHCTGKNGIAQAESYSHTAMVTVFENGVILKEYTFDEVRKNAAF
jgi:nicotinamide phosphoribosyltransferase